ncbi:hypothetical protein DB354_14775 [Opitutus sp. ER46]|nr:hypothetical protein DB354_14775 [Opitutus sp. ER46]
MVGALLAIILGLNWAAYDRYGSDMPNWDQWDAEGVHAIGPWFSGDHFVRNLFAAHNEHRVILTKAQNLALTLVNGQWDARLQSVVNALLHAGIAVGLWLLARRAIAPRLQPFAFAGLALLFGLPLSDQNLLSGFHSQQYWLIGLSLIAIALLPFSRPASRRWWAGLAAAILVLGSMGSGYLAATTVFGVVLWRALCRETSFRSAWPTLLVTGLITAFGEATRITVDYHASLVATNARDFVVTLLRNLEWPLHEQDWAGPFLWTPWLVLTLLTLVRSLRVRAGRPAPAAITWAIVALGGWAFGQVLATAYARGAGGAYPASRYAGTLIFGLGVNVLAALHLVWPRPAGPALATSPAAHVGAWRSALRITVVVLWALLLAAGLQWRLTYNLADPLPHAKQYYAGGEAHLRSYLVTGDAAQLSDPIPYITAEALVERLAVPGVRPLLPASVRPAVPLEPARAEGFTRNWVTPRTPAPRPGHGLAPDTPPLPARVTWGSFSTAGLAGIGEWRSQPIAPSAHAWLRFDIAGQLGEPGVSLELLDAASGKLLATVGPASGTGPWRAAYVRVPAQPFVIVAHDRDAHRWLAFSAPVEVATLSYLAVLVVRHALWLTVIGVLAAIAAFIRLARLHRSDAAPRMVGRDDDVPPAISGPARRRRTFLVVAVFFCVWCTKLAVIGRYGTDLPVWDQWAKEGELCYAPWFERHEFWAPLFLPHSEHRIAPTLALNLGLLRLGADQWDARVQCAVSAALHALIAAGLAAWALRRLPTGWALAVVGTIVLVTAPPIAWENVLLGFQSQFYFLIGFTLLALGGVLGAPAGSWRWCGGVAAAVVAGVSMGSGLLVTAPIALLAALRLRQPTNAARPRRLGRASNLATIATAVVLAAIGWWFRPQAPWHTPLHAHSFAEAAVYALRCLSWPLYGFPWLAPLLWLPWFVLATRRLISPFTREPRHGASVTADLVVAGGLWVLAQVAAVSFARGGGSSLPGIRYGDVFAVGVVLNAFALALLARSAAPDTRRASRFALTTTWSILVVAAVAVATRSTFQTELPQRAADHRDYVHNVRMFLRTDDQEAFAREPKLPFPHTDWLIRLLRNPTIRRIMPASVRAPIEVPGLRNDGSLAAVPTLATLWPDAARVVTAGQTWRSPALSADHGWWKIETAGDVGQSGTTFELVSARTGALLARIAPSKPAGAHWRAAYVRCPSEPAILVAHVATPARWVGFSEPVWVSPLSYRTWRLTAHAPLLAGASYILFAGALLLVAYQRRDGETTAPKSVA